MQKRYFDFGEQREVEVLAIHMGIQGKFIRHGTAFTVTDREEAFVILGHEPIPDLREGERGVITFTKGGPMNGYWHFERKGS